MDTQLKAARVLYYACSLTTFGYVAALTLIDACTVTVSVNASKRQSRWHSALIWPLVLSYTGEAVALIVAAALGNDYIFSQAHIVHVVSQALLWAVIGFRKAAVWYERLGLSLIVMAFEVPLFAICAAGELGDLTGRSQLVCQSIRLLLLPGLAIRVLYTWFQNRHVWGEESQPFLRSYVGNQHSDTVSYGTDSMVDGIAAEEDGSYYGDDDSDSGDEYMKKLQNQRLQDAGNWWTYLKRFLIFMPYLIPRKDRKVQMCLAINLLCLLGGRALNVLIPRQLGIITNKLVSKELPFKDLSVWLVLSLLSGESGIELIQKLVKIPIQQFSYYQITGAAFHHVMHLSMDFHNDRDSAEVMKAIEQGESLNNLLEATMTEIAPTIFDLVIAYIYLYRMFNIYVLLVMFVASISYISVDIMASNWNLPNRRRTTQAEREEARVMHQAVQGWETVSYFNNVEHEKRRFGRAVKTQLAASRDWTKLDAYIAALMELFVPTTFFSLSCLVLYQISRGHATPGDFVFLLQYWETLIYPLTYLSSHYRWLMADLVNAERLLTLLQTEPTITDREGAKKLGAINGHVTFKQVYFSYDPRKPTLTDINIDAKPGETVALVGMTGAGKSSILKLLLRFYDVSAGQIEIDGHDIRDVTLSSLRDVLGVVPQDPLLFNASIMENLRYAKLDATDEEVYEACRAAAIHDKIMTFPDKYQSAVGERGVKLSGGELQRVAIARVLLKNPPIFILDEAMSAVDTNTEAEIQAAFHRLRTGRTAFIIAHRLSTVVTADQILVVHDGRIVQRGTHQELLLQGGMYASLWSKQVGDVLE